MDGKAAALAAGCAVTSGGFGFVFPDRSLEDAGGRFVEGKRAFSPTITFSGATYCAYLSICLLLRPTVTAHSCWEVINRRMPNCCWPWCAYWEVQHFLAKR